ncbi:peptide ABC transporter substrate-binding protein [Rhodocista pekingensis]|uniref:Peptide ABC transporter substrate-binding protein n=1 Tax=Rhodocista pekingensis TaxID=201185 RepID=A0ABW2KXE3_9PROT
MRDFLRRAGLALTLVLAGALGQPAAAEVVLNRGNGPEPSSMDPQLGTTVTEGRIMYDLFEGLFTIGINGEPVPAVADSWEISPDGLVYTFRLRRDAKWSDGTPVTAEDFAFSWRRLLDPALASQYAYFLWPVKNAEAINKGEMPGEALGVEAVDPYTFRVTLERPTGYFLASLMHRITHPVQKANVERDGKSFMQPGKLVSNGAYQLVDYKPQSYVKVVKNPHYHDADQVKIDTVYFHHSDSQDTELRRFRAGELDAVMQIPYTQVDWVRQNMPEVETFYPVFSIWYLGFNMTKEPWASNAKLREALYLAIDREALVERITRAGEQASYSFVPAGTSGYRPPLPEAAALTQAQRDERARRLLKEAGYGPGGKPLPELEILHATSESSRRVMVAVAGMWKQKLNVDTRLNNQEFKVQLQTAADKNYVGLTHLGWIGDYPDAYTFLKLMRSDIGRMNRTGYASADFDRLLDEANLILDPERRAARMAEAEAVLLADLPVIPLFTGSYRTVVSPKVQGWTPNPMGFQLTRYLSIKP